MLNIKKQIEFCKKFVVYEMGDPKSKISKTNKKSYGQNTQWMEASQNLLTLQKPLRSWHYPLATCSRCWCARKMAAASAESLGKMLMAATSNASSLCNCNGSSRRPATPLSQSTRRRFWGASGSGLNLWRCRLCGRNSRRRTSLCLLWLLVNSLSLYF